VPQLVQKARQNIVADGKRHWLDSQILEIRQGEGWLGWPTGAPYDVIHVGAAADTIPSSLATQLKPNGIIMLPVGQPHGPQSFQVLKKQQDGSLTLLSSLPVRFVPLVKPDVMLEGFE
jgi:protein-L-isoaspartate(D-aspartate) O-methyltransferase